MRRIAIVCLTLAVALASSCEKKVDTDVYFAYAGKSITMNEGESRTPTVIYRVEGKTRLYDFSANPLHLEFTSSDETVLTVSDKGLVTALAEGEATVTAQSDEPVINTSIKVTVKSSDYTMPDISVPFSASLIYGQIGMKDEAGGSLNPQSLDIDDKGLIWAESAKRPFVYIQRFTQAGRYNTQKKALEGCTYDQAMKVYYAGHGTCLAVEPGGEAGNQYVWFANFGTKQSDGSYLQPRVLSRTKYVPGAVLHPQDAEEHFYFGERFIQMLPSIDFEGRVVGIWVSSRKLMAMYDLDEVLASPVKDITISGMTWGGDATPSEKYPEEKLVSVTIKAHDCQDLKPIAELSVSPGSSGTQGYCIYGRKHINYHLAGPSTPINVTLSVFDTEGNFTMNAQGFGFDDQLQPLIDGGLTDKESLEAEGITIRNNAMYICLASTMNKVRVTTILRF